MKLKGLKLFPEHGNITQLKRVKFGIDPTTSKLHLGHLVPLMVVKKLKEEKKDITIVLGNFTAQLGDPTGQEKTRPILSDIQIENNTEQIIKQIKNVLGDCRIVKNKDFMTSISANNFIKDVITKFNLSELLQRENFKNRGVALQELIVPLCQAMDSVFLETEIEVGGEDQMINFGITRQLQRSFGIKEEVCILCPIIKGTDGNKMSKSKNNCIFLTDPKEEIKNKVLKTSDEIVKEWFSLLIDLEIPEDPIKMKEVFIEKLSTANV